MSVGPPPLPGAKPPASTPPPALPGGAPPPSSTAPPSLASGKSRGSMLFSRRKSNLGQVPATNVTPESSAEKSPHPHYGAGRRFSGDL